MKTESNNDLSQLSACMRAALSFNIHSDKPNIIKWEKIISCTSFDKMQNKYYIINYLMMLLGVTFMSDYKYCVCKFRVILKKKLLYQFPKLLINSKVQRSIENRPNIKVKVAQATQHSGQP